MEALGQISFDTIKDVIDQYDPTMHDYLYVYCIPDDTYYISRSAVDRFALSTNCFTNVIEEHRKFVHPADLDMLIKDLTAMTKGKKEYHDLQYRWLGKNHHPIWINCKGVLVRKSGVPYLMLGCINEIGKKAVADNVTGLITEDGIQDHLKTISFDPKHCYLMEVSIDHLNDLRHKFGIEYAQRLEGALGDCAQKSIGEGQYAYHLNNGNVLIFDTVHNDDESIKDIYKSIRRGMDSFMVSDQYDSLYTISAGALKTEHVPDYSSDTLQSLSRFSVQEAKRRGRNRIYFFDMNDYSHYMEQNLLLSELREAVYNDFKGFDLYFQPIVNCSDEKLHGAEALLRYNSPDRGPVSPVDMIPLLEASGLIIPVGRWVLNTALDFCRQCRQAEPDFMVSVNVSYIQMLKSPLYEEVVAAIERAQVPPQALLIELTESGHLDNSPTVQSVWNDLRDYGVSIAIDDFGTGYSNLIMIGNLRPHIVKIDRGFAMKALSNDYEMNLLVHIIDMVHSLKLQLVVEGIETKDELDTIASLGPDFIQGYYYSRPLPAARFMEYVTDRDN